MDRPSLLLRGTKMRFMSFLDLYIRLVNANIFIGIIWNQYGLYAGAMWLLYYVTNVCFQESSLTALNKAKHNLHTKPSWLLTVNRSDIRDPNVLIGLCIQFRPVYNAGLRDRMFTIR